MEPNKPFNPLDEENHKKLTLSIAEALLATPIQSLPPAVPFVGAGVYAIYYTGKFPLYKNIAAKNSKGEYALPIYVGKAVPPGSRKGLNIDQYQGMVLYNRLKEHAESIRQSTNLDIKDFVCRYLVVEHIWIPHGESHLINQFSPLWNKAVDGFGNHDPGSGRYAQRKSQWDVLHPGRRWAEKLTGVALDTELLNASIAEYCKNLK